MIILEYIININIKILNNIKKKKKKKIQLCLIKFILLYLII